MPLAIVDVDPGIQGRDSRRGEISDLPRDHGHPVHLVLKPRAEHTALSRIEGLMIEALRLNQLLNTRIWSSAPACRKVITMRVVAAVALLCALGAPLAGQQPPARTFGAVVRLVPISVVVHDRNGKPVEGLTAADFTVTENGVEYPIVTFSVEARAAARPHGRRR